MRPGSASWSGKRRAPPRERDLAHRECFFRLRAGPPLTTVVAYIDEHRGQFGVQPICRVLTEHGVAIAPSSYYAAKKRPAPARAVRDAWLTAEITRVPKDNGEGYGARKVWLQLHREGISCARCTVERLMRQAGLRGVRRGRRTRTTIPAARGAWPPDPVNR